MHCTAEKLCGAFFVEKIMICKLFMNPIDKVGKQEYSFSSRTDRVLKQVKPVRQEVLETVKQLKNSRCFPFGSLLQGNALSAAADNAAEFVALSIQNTPAAQDTRYGVWFEPLLPRLCPASSAE